jgi:hypothetical protein
MAEKLNVQAKPEKPVIGPKLEARKKQGTITLVTPPSFFQNQRKKGQNHKKQQFPNLGFVAFYRRSNNLFDIYALLISVKFHKNEK